MKDKKYTGLFFFFLIVWIMKGATLMADSRNQNLLLCHLYGEIFSQCSLERKLMCLYS